MASKQAISRLRKELKAISADPPPHIHVSCDESNILSWSYLLEGPPDTVYEGGWYWGRLRFPKDYPFAPPAILMMTPSGRFETNTRLCLSMSDYHPESWQPAWSLATVLKGLLSFMCEDCPTAGAIDPPPPSEERRRLASCSASWNKGQAEFCKAFPEADSIMVAVAARKPQAETGPADEASADAGAQVPAVQETATVDAPEADAAPPATAALEEGAAVRLLGLQKRVDLNGKEGVVRTAAGQDAGGRVTVVVDDEPVSVKPENVERT